MLLKTIKALIAAAIMTAGVPALASHIVTGNESFASGAVFTGTLVFSDDYTVLENGTGILSGGPYGAITLDQTWFGGTAANPHLAGTLGNDWLLDGPGSGVFGTDYHHFIGFSWTLSGGDIAFLSGGSLSDYYTSLSNDDNSVDSVVAINFALAGPPGDGNSVPEPGSVLLLGAGVGALVGARRRKAA